MIVFSELISQSFFGTSDLKSVIIIMSPYVWLNAIYLICAEVLKGARKPISGILVQSGYMPVIATILLSTSSLLNSATATSASWVILVSCILVAVISIYLVNKSFSLRIRLLPITGLLFAALPMLLISSSAMILASIDTIMLGAFGTASEVALYNVALKVSSGMTIILTAISGLVAPTFASLYARGELKRLQALARATSLGLLIMAVLVGFPAIYYSENILSLFGSDYATAQSNDMLIVLIIAQMLSLTLGPLGYLLSMTGREAKLGKIFLTAIPINIFLNMVGYAYSGPVGIAAATALTILYWKFYAMIEVRKHLNFLILNYFKIDLLDLIRR